MAGVPAFKLVEAGFSQPQVEALADFMQTEAARRSDLIDVEHRLEGKILETEKRLESKIEDVRSTVRLHGWMLSFVTGINLLVLGKMLMNH